MLKRFVREEEGATMVEYGLMVALIAVVLIVIVSTLGQSLKGSFARTNTGVTNANTGSESRALGAAVTAPSVCGFTTIFKANSGSRVGSNVVRVSRQKGLSC